MSSRNRARRPGILRVCRRFLPIALGRWPALTLVGVATAAEILLTLLQPWPLKVLVDNVLGGQPLKGPLASAFDALPGAATTENLLVWTIGATVAIFLLTWGAGLMSSYANIWFGQRIVYDLGGRLFQHLQRLSLRFHARHGVGSLIRRITTDAESIATIVAGAVIPAFASVVALGSIFLVMWKLDATLTLLSLMVLPIMLLALKVYARPIADRSYDASEAEAAIYDTVEQTFSALPAVHAFTAEERTERKLGADTQTALGTAIAAFNAELRLSVVSSFATALGTAAILWLGAQHALDGRATVGTIIVFLAYLAALYAPLDDLTSTSTTLQEAMGSAWRVTEVLDAEPDVVDVPGAPALPRLRGHVRVEGVTFGYEPDRPVLRDVSLEARPGEVIAIVGATGAGKTTLASLIPRFFDPDEGRVTIDGYDLREVSLRSVRSQVALVLQESFLFPTTIGDNIAYGRPDASRAEIEAAARAANAHAFIERLPDGYDTLVGERGATLSGGERQRVAIARALLKDAPILILDEPTSALDVETEALLLEALTRLMAGRTTFIIAHRLSTIRTADRIVVLEDGRIVETGTHDELLGGETIYARLHALQRSNAASARTRVEIS